MKYEVSDGVRQHLIHGRHRREESDQGADLGIDDSDDLHLDRRAAGSFDVDRDRREIVVAGLDCRLRPVPIRVLQRKWIFDGATEPALPGQSATHR